MNDAQEAGHIGLNNAVSGLITDPGVIPALQRKSERQ